MSHTIDTRESNGPHSVSQIDVLSALTDRLAKVIQELQLDTPSDTIDKQAISSRELSYLAQAFYKFRRTREIIFDVDIFAEPAWDMLLDLFVAKQHGADVTISSVCAASAVPATTALRHIDTLVRSGLAHRKNSPRDARVTLVEISHTGYHKMDQLLREWPALRKTVTKKLAADD